MIIITEDGFLGAEWKTRRKQPLSQARGAQQGPLCPKLAAPVRGKAVLSASFQEDGAWRRQQHAVKVLKEIIACIKIFTPVEGLKPFPWALNSD